MLIDRIFVALEEALHEGFVHDGYRRRGFIVGRSEVTPAQDRHPKVLEIIGTYTVP